MKTLKYFLLIILFINCNCLFSQEGMSSMEVKAYRDCIKKFYGMLFSKTKVSIKEFSGVYMNGGASYEANLYHKTRFFKEHFISELALTNLLEKHINTTESMVLLKTKAYLFDLTLGFDFNEILALIDKSRVYNEGDEYTHLFELVFPYKKTIYFELNQGTPSEIENVWLTNGESLSNKVQGYKTEKLYRTGMVIHNTSYIEIKEKADAPSSYEIKIPINLNFYYTPDYNFEYWAIYKEDYGKGFIGYLNKNEILLYRNFSKKDKEKVKRARKGC